MALAMTKLRAIRDPAEIPLAPIAEDPRYKAERAKVDALEKRFEVALQRERVARARLSGQQPTASAESRAQALISGGSVTALPAEAECAAAQDEQAVLTVALVAANERLRAVVGEISFEVCKRFASVNAECLRNALDAATALFQALEAARVIRARLITGGYQLNETALPLHLFPTAAALGDPDRVGMTPAALFKQWLREKGIIL